MGVILSVSPDEGSDQNISATVQTADEWPFTSQLLERIAQSYDSDAEWHDTDANLRKRLSY